MGPGITLATLGASAAVPTALIFCFDNILLFTLLPLMMALGGTEKVGFRKAAFGVLRQILTHLFIVATAYQTYVQRASAVVLLGALALRRHGDGVFLYAITNTCCRGCETGLLRSGSRLSSGTSTR
ncbi:hypothetical protein [Breoghania sp.]|uniref:hypothetical protein n=1 Tax=Breoghania sp. TaxID=2065378 RepID=UPI002622643D|nr:hypothetical protein [Breoghania sp.]MDJ0929542.1 hypothetical protein [Breoghania sp.]